MADSNNIDNFEIQQENDFEKISAPGAAEMEQESADQPPKAQDGQVTSSEAAAAADSNGEGDLEEQFNMVDGKEVEGLSPSSDPEPLVPLDDDTQVASPAQAQAAEAAESPESESQIDSQADSVADPFMSVSAEVEAAAAAEAVPVSESEVMKSEVSNVSESQPKAPAEDIPPAEPFIQEPVRSESPKQCEISEDPKPNLVDLDLISDAVVDNTEDEASSQIVSSSAEPLVDMVSEVEPLVAAETADVVRSEPAQKEAIDEVAEEVKKEIESLIEEESPSSVVDSSVPDLIAEDNVVDSSSGAALAASLAASAAASAPAEQPVAPQDISPIDVPSESEVSEIKPVKEEVVSVNSNEEEATEGMQLQASDWLCYIEKCIFLHQC